MSDNFYSTPNASAGAYSEIPSGLAHSKLPNQNHAIQYSSKFTSNDDKKPIPLAHFMGARKDLNGPVLTKQRVDEKEVKPDGWELAERRYEILSKQATNSGGVNSLASLLGGTPHASHASNPTKRALPGMVSQDKLEQDRLNRDLAPSIGHVDKFKQRSLPIPPIQSHSGSSFTPSNPDAFLKPKSLADRLAQLGVVNDPQHAKPLQKSLKLQQGSVSQGSSPIVERFADRTKTFQVAEEDMMDHDLHDEKSVHKPHHFNRSKSTYNLKSTASLDEAPALKDQKHSGDPAASSRSGARVLNSDTSMPPEPTISQTPQVRPTMSNRAYTTQVAETAHNQKNNKSQSYPVISPHNHMSSEQTGNSGGLGVPSKALTASLSRLAGSNIVAQRLQWSKQKEQTGTNVDEFGTPGKTSPVIPSSHFPAPTTSVGSILPNSSTFMPLSDTSNQSTVPKRPTVFDRQDHTRAPSPHKSHHASRFQHTRADSLPSDVPPTPSTPTSKNINQYNKSNRAASDEDDELQSENHHDLKRNKKDGEIPKTPVSPRKGALGYPKTPASMNRSGISGVGVTGYSHSTDASPPLKHLTKNRARGPQRSGIRTGAQTKSPPPAHRPLPSPNLSKATDHPKVAVPSITSFSPVVQKGTSELAAVWENQRKKKLIEIKPSGINPTSTRPLPMPPKSTLKEESHYSSGIRVALPGLSEVNHTPTATTTSTRPLPVPPSFSVTAPLARLGPTLTSKTSKHPLPSTPLTKAKKRTIVVKREDPIDLISIPLV